MFRPALIILNLILIMILATAPAGWAEPSPDTEACLDCHTEATPAVLPHWQTSKHFKGNEEHGSVGCAECHTRNADKHPDSFDHNGYQVHTIVSPADCADCHKLPAAQYSRNMMAHAYANLVDNPLYMQMAADLNGVRVFKDGKLSSLPQTKLDLDDSCLSCHGTRIKVGPLESRNTVQGEMDFPVLEGWPNQGVGRVNPDDSLGGCTACHPRHGFSIETARKPYTCSQCHKGPDVPAYKIWQVSKHGNIFSSQAGNWNFKPKNWTVGRDYTAPTCAVCHISAMTTPDGEELVGRTHLMSERLDTRLFGPVYAVPHPAGPKTHLIKNRAGQHLPADLADANPAAQGLISPEEATRRRQTMKAVCTGCHAKGWIDGHFKRLDRTILTTNETIKAATALQLKAWERGFNNPENHFDETLERLWAETWLFYANSVRMSSAMAGADYGVFDKGRWDLGLTMTRMADMLQAFIKTAEKDKTTKK